MDETEEVQQNMVSNLPLLFANGYPTSLSKITSAQLENFIPFMVQCSLGHINLQDKIEYSEPEWWPEDIPFTIPVTKPKKFDGNWIEKMKEIVVICYQFHKSVFLLRFCNELASYEPARLRFINNYNSTTSLYERRCNKLLVTFRNENMSYDQPQRNRKSLLKQKSRSQTATTETHQQMVEPALFDIYLCDNCDAELYSLEAITEHEKTCISDDDVIICDTPNQESSSAQHENHSNNKPATDNEQRQKFLLNFSLQSRNIPPSLIITNNNNVEDEINTLKDKTKEITIGKNSQLKKSPLEKLKRLPRRNRGVYALSRCPMIALSSPAGQLLIKNSKTLMTEDYLSERLDRMERFCHAPFLSSGIHRPKFLDKKFLLPHVTCTFKKPIDYNLHTYIFPTRHRQFSAKHRMENFMFLNSLLLKRCRPLFIRVKKLSDTDYYRQKHNPSIGSLSYSNNNGSFNIRLKRENAQSTNWKITPNSCHNVIDTIDLCSSDDDDDGVDDDNATHGAVTVDNHQERINQDTQIITPHQQRITSECTLTPITRSIENKFDDTQKKKYEGNFLLSQTQYLSGNNQPKPLQPSVFLFSNYTTTETIHFRHHNHHHFGNANGNSVGGGGGGLNAGGTNGISQQPQKLTNLNVHNQENFENSKLLKRKSTDDWLQQNNSTSRNSDRNGKVKQLMSFVDNEIIKISSPNRSISIDLTL